MARKKKEPFYDDGRTIASMNVPGMPWNGGGPLEKPSTQKIHEEPRKPMGDLMLTKEEKRAMCKGALAAVVPIAAIFALAYFGIFLFLDLVWLS